MKSSSIIKTAQHTTKFSNKGKLEVLRAFMKEYDLAVNYYIDYLWSRETSYVNNKGEVKTLDVSNSKFDLPMFVVTSNNRPTNTPGLSDRILKSASQQALGIVSSVIAKRNKLVFKLNLAIHRGEVDKATKLQTQLDQFVLTKPSTRITTANLDSNTVEFVTSNKSGGKFQEFDGFLRITSMSKTFGFIEIPVKFHRHVNKLVSNGYQRKNSWFISLDKVSSIWEKAKPSKKPIGKKIGADQGITTCLTLSDGQVTSACAHRHDLASIMARVARCERGSNGFKRATAHRTNYINWAVKQLDFTGISELAYENVRHIRKGQSTSRYMQGWTYTAIRTAVEAICTETGVQLTEQSSIYRSQRCSICGFVHKKNRAKKVFKCRECGHELDADLNGAMNHESDLPSVPYSLMSMKLNLSGFYWLGSGIYDLHGEEITVPPPKN